MRDQHIRAAFHRTILAGAHKDTSTQVIDELGLKNGEIRADIAVINGKIFGYEIKTDKDNLLRLSSQVSAYSDVFHQAYVITGEKHLQKVLDKLPEWWGVYGINISEENVISFNLVRPGQKNVHQNPFTLAQLLWKEEVIKLLQKQYNCVAKISYTKQKLYEILVKQCNVDELSENVLSIIKKREGWRTSPSQLL
ncbi:sce7726 family protein [Pedobacter gandavensis]|uniref:sce7726 family protein n=1 Tax=Pedobacter gandavensis TaxID=2679963 RepID=UPI00247AB6CC|nr:sce7726 family protein [Pedobacter gandavensis]WGQ09933.1 sce7726 family protein [Pedobacter gandavensis]